MNETQIKKPTPAYVSAKTFKNFVDGLRAGVPQRIDRSVLPSMSGANQNALITSLRYLKLIKEDGPPTDSLKALARSEGTERQKQYAAIVKAAYPFLFGGSVDLESATSKQIEEIFAEHGGTTGDTTRKCIAFFTAIAKDADIKLSRYLKRSPGPRLGSTRRRSAGNATNEEDRQDEQSSRHSTGQSSKTPAQVIYEIFDPTKMNDQEQAAIWTLLTYLRKAEIAQ